MRLLLSPSGAQTMSPLDGGATGHYYDWGELVGYERPDARRVVLLGLGGGEMLRAVRRSLPKAELVGVELDPRIAAAALKSFHVDRFGVDAAKRRRGKRGIERPKRCFPARRALPMQPGRQPAADIAAA